ncbi:transcription antiterminator [Clostridium sp. D2Q-11]|uniref:Transcription antiterminator n=1 Tax=Anaeromonas frigoriresistens TaxID=2683708 RepID=A0A942USN9_9FIRM|nr:BglG family transcription antiterminator [Anaeromonas frigoriresistens]MBS4537868.1 transcription antiterminator [Anaeromonas frigoriresistens]
MLDERKKEIINILIGKRDFITINELSTKLSVSSRTTRYDLDAVDIWLESTGFPTLIRIPRKGIKLDFGGGELKEIRKHFTSSDYYNYVLSPEERMNVVLLELLKSSKPLTLSILADKTYVSTTTIYNDLKNAEEWLEKFDIKVISKTGYGLYIKGKEVNQRQAISKLLKSLATSSDPNTLEQYISILKKWFPNLDIAYVKDTLLEAQELLQIKFSYEGLSNLIFHIVLSIERISSHQPISMEPIKLQEMMEKEEYKIAKRISTNISSHFNIEVPIDEMAYITLHLIGAKLSTVENQDEYLQKNRLLSSVIDQMIIVVERGLNLKIKNHEQLKKDLYIHLNPTLNRLLFNKTLQNPLLDEIKTKYKEIFLASTKACEILEENFNVKITDHEIAYITMHFGAAIEAQYIHKENITKVLLVCASRIGTSKLLSIKLKSYFRNFKIVDILSHENIDNHKNNLDFDLIISTIPIKNIDKPIALVSPLLNQKDIETLSSYLNYKGSHSSLNYKNPSIVVDLINIISEHCDINNLPGLQSDITGLLNNINKFMEENDTYLDTSSEILPRKLIQVNVDAKDWKDAIVKSSLPFLDHEYIKEEYVDSIIKRIDKYGPYMVIAPGIAMPHSSSEEGALKTGLSITTLKNPVKFNHKTNDPIHTIIMLSATNNYTHIEALTEVLEVISEKSNLELLKNSKNLDTIYKLFTKEDEK